MFHTHLIKVLGATALVAATLPVHAALVRATYNYTEQKLTVAGASNTLAMGLNNAGVVVGLATWSTTAFDFDPLGWPTIKPGTTPSNVHAIVWNQGLATDLGPGKANAINSANHIAGASFDASGNEYATVWVDQKPTLLGLGAAYGININDEIVGEAPGLDGIRHPAVWRQGVVKLLSTQAGRATGINAAGQIIGYVTSIDSSGATNYSAVRWAQDVPTILASTGMADDINDAGLVVGASQYRPYYWTPDNQAHDLNPRVTWSGRLTATNKDGLFVGSAFGSAFIWGPYNALLNGMNFTPTRLNDAGDMVGDRCYSSGSTGGNDNCSAYVYKLNPEPVACTIQYTLVPVSSTAFTESVVVTSLSLSDLIGLQVNETLKDPTIVYKVSQAKIKVSGGGTKLVVTPTSTNPTMPSGSTWEFTFNGAKFPSTNPSVSDLSATMGGKACVRLN